MSGQITRKDIITDEALKWGSEYAKVMEEAIGKNREFVDTIVALNAENVKLRRSENQTEYLKQKNEVKLLTEKTNASIKEQLALETSLEKIKQEKIRTEKLELDAINKKAIAQKRSNTLTIEERVQNEVNNRALKQTAREKLGLVGAYEKLNRARTESKKRLLDLLSAEERNIVAIRKAQKEYDILDRKVRMADKAVGDFTKNVGNYPFSNAASGLRNLIGAFGLTTGIALFAGIMQGAYKTIKEFEQGVADLRAITGATGKDLEFLKNSALSLGTTVKGGAIAVVEAYKLIASAKPELLENVQALNSVTEAAIQLSQAAGMELPDAATALTDALNQFNAPAEKAGEFVDALANGAKYGAAEIPQTTEALLKFGAVARTSNISIQESVALIELLAENGIKGAEAGTKLRNVLLKISAPDALPKEARKEFERLGISLNFLKDTTIPIQEKLTALKPLLKDNSSIVKIFGDENATAAINVLSHTSRLADLIPKMGEFGTAAEQADIRMDTLNGKTEILKSTYDSFILSVGEGGGVVSNFFKLFVDGTTNGLNLLIRLNSSWDELNEKARNEGASLASKVFKVDNKSIEELEAQRSKLFDEASKLRSQIKEAETQLAELGNFALLGDGGLNKRIESLYGELGQIEGAWEKSRDKINSINEESNKKIEEDEKAKRILTEEELKKILAAQKKAIEDYLKLLNKRNKDEFDLNQFRLEREIYYNQLILDDENQSNESRVNSFLQIEQLKKASLDETLAYELKNIALSSDAVKNLNISQIKQLEKNTDQQIQTLINSGKLKENATKEEIRIYEKYVLELKKLDDKRKADVQKLIDSQANIIQKQIDAENQSRDTAYNNKITQENNLYKNALEVAGKNFELIEQATKEHEKRLLTITQQSNKEKLQFQINSIQTLLDENAKLPVAEQISADKRAEIQNKLSQYRKELSELNIEVIQNENDFAVESEKERQQKIIDILAENSSRTRELQENLASSLIDLTNSIFQARISAIDNDLNYWNDYYDAQIELAGDDARQKELLERDKAKKAKELEKERKKEMVKAAIFNKVLSLAQIGIDLAKTLSAIQLAARMLDTISFGTAGLPYQGLQTGLAIGVAAAQSAAILLQPLPKYKDGRKGGPAEFAWTGDGGRSEVISNPDGSNPRLTPSVPTLTYLKQGEVVHKSEEDYHKSVRASLLNEYDKSANEVKQYQIEINNNTSNANLDKIIKKGIIDGFKKARNNVSITNKIDFGHELWKMNNTNWNRK